MYGRGTILTGTAMLLTAALLASCSKTTTDSGKLPVAATIVPLADLVEHVGGGRVAVTCIVPPGSSEHGFDITAQGRSALAGAALIVSAGPTDDWLRPNMIPAKARLIRLSDLLPTTQPATAPASEPAGHEAPADQDEEGQADGHHHHDPHYWLNPDYMASLSVAVGDALAQLDPAGSAEYRASAAAYAAQCRQLAEQMKAAGASFKHKVFVAQHPAYQAMGELMGLRQADSIQVVVGASPSPGHLEGLVDQIIRQGIPAIYTEPELDRRDAQAIVTAAARKGYAVKLLELDPLGNPRVPGRRTYLENMRTNLAALEEGLNGAPGH
jgi:zinc transport system substrate-binding protein